MRACFDGGVSRQEDRKVKHKVGSAYVIQASERIEEAAEKMEWRTKGEVAKVLPHDAMITQAESHLLPCSNCQIIFDLAGNLIEELDENAKRTSNRMKENTEERRRRKLDDGNHASVTDISHSSSASLPAVTSHWISAKEMTSLRCFKLGAKPKWTAQPAPTQPCPNCGDTTIPPWRDKSLWIITTTKTVEDLVTENQSSGSKKKMEELCEMMKKKHAKVYANLLQEYEEGKQRDLESENEANEEVEGKDQEFKG